MYQEMKRMRHLYRMLLLLGCVLHTNGLMNAQSISRMRCEYSVRPICIDASSPRLTWNFQANGDLQQHSYRILVGTDATKLAEKVPSGLVWDSGIVTSSLSRAVYRGKDLQPFTRYYWRVIAWDQRGRQIDSPVESFETALMRTSDWRALWITDGRHRDFEPAPMFRKSFQVDGVHVRQARFYCSAAAYGCFKINGSPVSQDLLNPGYTHYDKRNLYSVYDVGSLLRQGTNVISAVLGNGFYNEIGKVATWGFESARWRNRARMTCMLRMEMEDGTVREILSDGSWRTAVGPYLVNNIYAGDKYDSRLEKKGWELAGYDDSDWQEAMVVGAPSPLLAAQKMPAIRVSEELGAQGFRSQGDTLFIYDFGKNISGFCKLRIQGNSGTLVRLQHGEIKLPNNRLEVGNIACYYSPMEDKEFQTDTYMLNGKLQELSPQFCYHGFQYVEVRTSQPVHLTKESLRAEFFHTALEPVGMFECSDELFNKLSAATHVSYLSNLQSIPTDCPQREKNGWTADAHMSMDLALLNYDGILLYEKWLDDFLDNQNDSGRISGIIPSAQWGYDDWIGPVWDAAMFGIPMTLYYYYGDTRPIEKMWPACVKYLNYLKGRENAEKTVTYGIGDWVYYKTQTPTDYTTTCYYYFDNRLMAEFARLLGKDGTAYEQKAQYLRQLIQRKYFDREKALFSNGSQAAQGVALYLGLVPREYEQRVADNLSQMIAANGGALDCGMLGSKTILRMLCKYGYADQAFQIANRTEAPSWGNWIKRGLTSLAETWNLSPTFKDASLNHVFLGDIHAWMYQYLAGINYDEAQPGFKHILLQPYFVKGLDWAKGLYRSPMGMLKSEWVRRHGRIVLDVEIPANTSATLSVDGKKQELHSGRHHFVYEETKNKH